ncbi:MAG: ATP-grasp domain-containing protein [Mesorhizobium sp.]|uniref:ATP-grasp domain-containing protein n=1 Tax=Mesorhizobium sp. TaxID=1871066 RepID=UPI000FEA37F7|nr:acetyl-CoA carboxylase biotin carboxylase subunit family protein [Mesorhizobium sp.]RWD55900.1 MAG: ATP-grasp domain-containing protein [Mesorhizobium sp.]RWE30647.1 MAG: ATP-grasp domain-containing protein [Mesorhizobium sp.]
MATRALILVEGHPRLGLQYVQIAKRLGLHPITLSADPAQYEYLSAENVEAVHVDTDNLDSLIRECTRLSSSCDIVGVTGFSRADESACVTAAKLCRYLKLPGPNPTSMERCCDKFAQRQLLARAGVPVPAYRLASNATEVERSAAEMTLPVILKPAVGSGSCGVRLCRNVDELTEHTAYLLGNKHLWRSSPRILVEEFAQGLYYEADIMGDEVISIGTAELWPPPHFVFREVTYPAPLNDNEYKCIADVSLACLRALDLGWGPTNIEFRWTKRGPVVIEVNPRIPGTPWPELVRLAYGVDLICGHIKVVIGDEPDLRRRQSHTATARLLVPDHDGILDWIDGTRAAAIPGLAEVKFYVEPGTPVARKGNYRDYIGHVIAASPSCARTEAIVQRAVDSIDRLITPFPTLGEQ